MIEFDMNLTSVYFSNGLVQPPTSLPLPFFGHHETLNRALRWHLYGVLVEDLPLPRAKYSKMRQRLLLHLPMGQISGGPIGLQQIDSKKKKDSDKLILYNLIQLYYQTKSYTESTGYFG